MNLMTQRNMKATKEELITQRRGFQSQVIRLTKKIEAIRAKLYNIKSK